MFLSNQYNVNGICFCNWHCFRIQMSECRYTTSTLRLGFSTWTMLWWTWSLIRRRWGAIFRNLGYDHSSLSLSHLTMKFTYLSHFAYFLVVSEYWESLIAHFSPSVLLHFLLHFLLNFLLLFWGAWYTKQDGWQVSFISNYWNANLVGT